MRAEAAKSTSAAAAIDAAMARLARDEEAGRRALSGCYDAARAARDDEAARLAAAGMLLWKCLYDHCAQRMDATTQARIAAHANDFLRRGGASPAWQARPSVTVRAEAEGILVRAGRELAIDVNGGGESLMSRFNRTLAALAAALACVATAEAAQAASPTWITLDDDAYALLRGLDAGATPSASRTLVMSAPGGLRDVLSVHAVAIDAAVLPRLSQAVHDSLHHCGGYMVHASLAEAKEALSRIDAAPAAAPSYAIDNQATVNDLLPHIDEGKVLASIQRLSDYRNRYYASSTGVAASDWLAQAWALLGRNRSDVSVRQVTHAWPQKSVVLTIRGTTAPDEIVVIGGHLDSIAGGKLAKAPGADDDASGIASLAEVARTLIQSGYQPKRTIEFMAYAAEEEGLLGSADIARDYATQGRNVVGVLQLDMTNYMGSIDDIYVITDFTNAAQNAFLHDLASAYLPALAIGETRCGYACSDHASWNSRGYIASFPFESGFGEDNPYIHTKEDTLDKSGNVATHAAKFSRLALAYAVELGSD